MADLPIGSELAGCRVEEILGTGGMGVIYRATDVRLGRPVALKLISADGASDPTLRERFAREGGLTAAIDHPNVIPVYGAGEEDGHLYLVMRYVPGTDLHALLRREGRLAPARAADVLAQLRGAPDAAHAPPLGAALDAAPPAGLVHRDVKPANVLIAGTHVYLSDFGITRVQDADTQITTSGWIGTVDFMAPEHLRGEPTDARADVYALGCVLFTVLTGAPPFRRPTVPATITAHLHDPPPRPSDTPGVPAAFDAVIARALAKETEDRYHSAGDLGRAALAAAAGQPASAPRGSVARGEAAGGVAVPGSPPTVVTRIAADADETAVAGSTAIATEVASDGADEDEATRVAAEPPPAGTPRPGGGRPPKVRVQRGRRRKLVRVLTTLVLAIPALAVVAYVLASPGQASGPLSASEVDGAAQAFATAYSNEDVNAMRRVLTPRVRRIGADGVERGRVAVLAEYRSQFAAGDVERYPLADLTTSGGRAGRAEGRYTVTRRGIAPLAGRVVLGVVRFGGEARIDLIATEPRG